jgi:hypothetical protein
MHPESHPRGIHTFVARSLVWGASLWLAAVACGTGDATTPTSALPTPVAPPEMSQAARAYLNEIVDIMQNNSMNRLAINWDQFRARTLGSTPFAQTIADTYPAIRVALGFLGDGHSAYVSVTGVAISVRTKSCIASNGGKGVIPENVGYVAVTTFGDAGEAATNYAAGMQAAIKAADRDDLIGWVVDLRGNLGGNMWPMVAGIGPILGDDVAGYFISPTNREIAWGYGSGASLADGRVAQAVPNPYRLKRERPKVAVLIDNGTASSGEGVAISFIQRPNARLFGGATCGLSTGVSTFRVSDGAQLGVATDVMADRTHKPFGDAILPDETISETDALFRRVVAWLQPE